jgi:hypothetical protein
MIIAVSKNIFANVVKFLRRIFVLNKFNEFVLIL